MSLFKKKPQPVEAAVCKKLSADETLEQIFHYMQCLFEERELSNALQLLTDLGRVLVGSDRASFWYWSKRTKEIWTLAASDIGKIAIPEDSGLVGAAVLGNQTLIVNDPYSDPRFNKDIDKGSGYITRSILTLPVTNSLGEVIGAYQAINKISDKGVDDGRFTDDDAKRLSMAAAFCAKSLESYMLYNAALEDQLTGLKNRRGFYAHYDKFITPLVDEGVDCSLFICDIDFFKKVNDTYGHNGGDEVLRHVADQFMRRARVDDGVFRWGGEEFIFLLPRTDIYQAQVIAESLREAIMAHVIPFEGQDIHITMSFGVSQIDAKEPIDAVVKGADEKLYTAKQQGRNRVII